MHPCNPFLVLVNMHAKDIGFIYVHSQWFRDFNWFQVESSAKHEIKEKIPLLHNELFSLRVQCFEKVIQRNCFVNGPSEGSVLQNLDHSENQSELKNWFMLGMHISSHGWTWEVWRAWEKCKSCSRRQPRATLAT